MTILLDSFVSLPKGNYYIYGAGQIGQQIRKKFTYTDTSRIFKGFLSSFDKGHINDDPIYNVSAHKEVFKKNDSIIIANQFSREIIHTLKSSDIPCQLYDGILLVFPWNDHSFTNEESDDFTKRSRAIIGQLNSDRSKSLYEFLVSVRYSNASLDKKAMNALFYQKMDKFYGQGDAYYQAHYFEYDIFQNIQCVIEGGSNLGLVSQRILEHMPASGHLYSFEPLSQHIKNASQAHPVHRTLQTEQEKGRYTLISKALWSEETSLYFKGEGQNFSNFYMSQSGDIANKISATSIDAFSQENNIRTVDFIKLDVEGAEPDVLAGAINCLKNHRPRLAVSIYHGPTQMITLPEFLMNTLENYTFEIGHHSNTPWQETVLYCIPKSDN